MTQIVTPTPTKRPGVGPADYDLVAPCSTRSSQPGRDSFRLLVTEAGIRIDTPSVYTRTHWTRAQLRDLREALGAVLTETSGGAR